MKCIVESNFCIVELVVVTENALNSENVCCERCFFPPIKLRYNIVVK